MLLLLLSTEGRLVPGVNSLRLSRRTTSRWPLAHRILLRMQIQNSRQQRTAGTNTYKQEHPSSRNQPLHRPTTARASGQIARYQPLPNQNRSEDLSVKGWPGQDHGAFTRLSASRPTPDTSPSQVGICGAPLRYGHRDILWARAASNTKLPLPASSTTT